MFDVKDEKDDILKGTKLLKIKKQLNKGLDKNIGNHEVWARKKTT